jgi:hypothetical protein
MHWKHFLLILSIVLAESAPVAVAGNPQKGEYSCWCEHGSACRDHRHRCPEPPRVGIVESVPIRRLGLDPEERRGARDFDDIDTRVRRLEDMVIKLVSVLERQMQVDDRATCGKEPTDAGTIPIPREGSK